MQHGKNYNGAVQGGGESQHRLARQKRVHRRGDTIELALEGRLGTNILRREKEDSVQKKQHKEPESREATVCSEKSMFPESHSIN